MRFAIARYQGLIDACDFVEQAAAEKAPLEDALDFRAESPSDVLISQMGRRSVVTLFRVRADELDAACAAYDDVWRRIVGAASKAQLLAPTVFGGES